MPQKIALDIGGKRTGIAMTDQFNIIASGLTTVQTDELIPFLEQLFNQHDVDVIAIGYPTNLNGTATHSTELVLNTIQILEKKFPTLEIRKIDERFTSKMASQAILDSGAKKKQRRNKELVDKVSATIILQSYLEIYNR